MIRISLINPFSAELTCVRVRPSDAASIALDDRPTRQVQVEEQESNQALQPGRSFYRMDLKRPIPYGNNLLFDMFGATIIRQQPLRSPRGPCRPRLWHRRRDRRIR